LSHSKNPFTWTSFTHKTEGNVSASSQLLCKGFRTQQNTFKIKISLNMANNCTCSNGQWTIFAYLDKGLKSEQMGKRMKQFSAELKEIWQVNFPVTDHN
jgi:hypothetical protein